MAAQSATLASNQTAASEHNGTHRVPRRGGSLLDLQQRFGGLRFGMFVHFSMATFGTAPEPGNVVPGAFNPVLAKHSKSFSLIDCVSVGVDMVGAMCVSLLSERRFATARAYAK